MSLMDAEGSSKSQEASTFSGVSLSSYLKYVRSGISRELPQKLHNDMSMVILGAPVKFFDENSVG